MSEALIVDAEVRATSEAVTVSPHKAIRVTSASRFSAQGHIKGRVGLFSAAFVELCGETRERQDSG